MKIRIGTRKSLLAVAQALEVCKLLHRKFPEIEVEIIKINTSGDKNVNKPLYNIGGKGLFLKEIELYLLKNKIDIAIHSMKDVPAFYTKGLIIPCIIKRCSPYDAFISKKYKNIESLPKSATIGTSSIRRKVQILHFRPDLKIIPLRGNINTRLEKLSSENLDAIILAEAGLMRINIHDKITQILPPDIMLSAVGQGAICIQCRQNDEKIVSIINLLNDKQSHITITAERSFMKAVNGSCTTPLAALAKFVNKEKVHIKCMLADEKNLFFSECIFNYNNAEIVGAKIGLELIKKIKVC